MPRLLKLYLIFTGIPALLALAMPDLVTIGLFLLIIPGLILAIAPTAFLWGCIYAVAQWLTRSRLGPKFAALAAVPLTAAVLWAIPQPSQMAAQAALAQYQLPAVKSAAPIRPEGDIRIEAQSPPWDNANTQRPGFRPYACDNRCLALLFEPGVRSVTMASSAKLTHDEIRDGKIPAANEFTRTYRLLARGQCGAAGITPDIEGETGHFGKSLEDNRAIAAEWNVRLTSDFCLVSQAPIERHDLLLRMGEWRLPGDDSRRTNAYYAEIRGAANHVLMRNFDLHTDALAAPLWIEGSGSMESFHFGWGRNLLPKGEYYSWEEPGRQLDSALAVRRTADMARVLAATRNALQAAIANPALASDSAIFKSVRTYLELLAAEGATPADLGLVEGLIADARLDDLDGAWLLPKVFDAAGLQHLRPVIIAKLGALPVTADPRTRSLGGVLKSWPKGAFVQLSGAERQLLGDVNRRRRANGLIGRLSDMGAPGAPLLAEIAELHLQAAASLRAMSRQDRDNPDIPPSERDHGFEAHQDAASAAVTGLCRLGPAALGELARLTRIERSFTKDGFGGRDWDRMMVRVGKPVDQVRKPENLSGSEANYQRNLRAFLDRFDPERDCD